MTEVGAAGSPYWTCNNPSQTVNITNGMTSTVSFTNFIHTGNLTVSKQITGIYESCSAKRMEKLLDENGKPVLDENGKEKKVEVPIPYFRPGNVFDVSQTVGKPVETLSPKELMNSVDGYENFLQSLISISPVKVVFDNIESGAKGIYYPNEEKIVVQTGMSNLQTLKTLIHESAHARLHNNQAMEKTKKNRETEEVEAESVAYCVLSAFGFDTSDYSFPYIAGWSSGKDMKELKESLETIRITSGQFIDEIQKVLEQKAA